jgi:tetratricopeptide (TPR) repeat protein
VLFVRSGRSSLDSGDVAAAEAAIARADELEGETAALCLLRADVHRARGRWVEAGVEVERARSLSPRDPDVRDAVATHYRDVGYAFLLRATTDAAQRRRNRAQAEEAFRRALAADPPRVDLDEVRRLLERGMEPPKALEGSRELVEAFDRALAEAKRLVDEGAEALRAGEPETARQRFRESLRNYESPPARFGLGVALSALDRHEEAERAYEMAVDVDPRYAEAWLNLGGLRYRREDWAGAEEAYMEYLTVIPASADARVVEQVQTLVLSCRREKAKAAKELE